MVQAESLWEDGDLDLYNNLGQPEEDQKNHFHISPNARDGHWYSWHPFGLSWFLAPALPAGDWVAHLVIACFAATALAGVMVLMRRLGADRSSAWLVLGLWSLGLFWFIYASRLLPEVPGAAMAVWCFWAIDARREAPGRSALVLTLCAGLMPWLHTRFLPLAGILCLCYGIAGLAQSLRDRSWKPLRPVAAAAAGSVLLLGLYFRVHLQLFAGAAPYPSGSLLLAYPMGMWQALGSARGILYALPLAAVLLPAGFIALTRKELRGPASVALLAGA
ncbi:MAG: hypothetical protein KDL10_05390, partial [Kiritimatiellae bacterium]|nr:hypothetical protein [Kiritimatiellia bacterium]